MKNKISVFWFRRDLRIEDNIGLYHALKSGFSVLPIFIYDTTILNQLEDKQDRRVDYIHQALQHVNLQLKQFNTSVLTFFNTPVEAFNQLITKYQIEHVYCNKDYEPQAIQRDLTIENLLTQNRVGFYAFKDQVIFESNDILKADGTPYTVYTFYAKKWMQQLTALNYTAVSLNYSNFYKTPYTEILSISKIGFKKTDMVFEIPKLDIAIIAEYDKYRDFPAMQKTTMLGIALRFGTISIRQCVAFALQHNQTWLSELIWREFFMQILFHFPYVTESAFKKEYDLIEWQNNEEEFDKWCKGITGYPLVDAGMRQLNATGYMHNRVRMVVGSFLCKHLLIDWRWGELYFAQKLNDYDLSANNGNWQWVAGCGCDAATYFRVFNPQLQLEKFDKNLDYVKKWVPEYGTPKYCKPIVEHQFARQRVLSAYLKALKK